MRTTSSLDHANLQFVDDLETFSAWLGPSRSATKFYRNQQSKREQMEIMTRHEYHDLNSADRVRANTIPDVNALMDRDTDVLIHCYATRGKQEIAARLGELDREWDVERWLETNASALALNGLCLGVVFSKKWFTLPGTFCPSCFNTLCRGGARRCGCCDESDIVRKRRLTRKNTR